MDQNISKYMSIMPILRLESFYFWPKLPKMVKAIYFIFFEKTKFLFSVILVLLNGLAFLIPVTDNWSKCAAHLISTSDPISTPSLDTIEDLNFSFHIQFYSAISKMSWTWSKVRFLLINLQIWTHSKTIYRGQKLLITLKNILNWQMD